VLSIWIDPSYKGTGICVVNSESKQILFNLLAEAQTKRVLVNYYRCADILACKMRDFFTSLYNSFPVSMQHCAVYMEAPFPGGFSSPGLYGLQFEYLNLFKSLSYVESVRSIPPSFVSNAVKKFMDVKKEKSSTRKSMCLSNKSYFESCGWSFLNYDLLLKEGDDVATAFIFFTESVRQIKSWPYIIKDGKIGTQFL
jgi:hypothetical protein